MARRPTYLKMSAKVQVEKLQRKCRYCKIHRNVLGFDKHEAWCKQTWTIRKELQVWHAHPTTDQFEPQAVAMSLIPPKTSRVDNEFVEGSSTMPMEIGSPPSDTQLEDDTVIAPSGMLIPSLLTFLFLMFTGNIADPVVVFGPHLPHEYIKIIPHSHSPNPTTQIIALSTMNPDYHSNHSNYMPRSEPRPWAPFKNLADFEYTETAILGLLPKWIINKQLGGINDNWAEGSRLTIKNSTEMEKILSNARQYFVQVSTRDKLPSSSPISFSHWQFKSDVVMASYMGTAYSFIFEYRDPWEWILSVIQEESLAPMAMWNAVRKYYCSGDFEERIYDEPNTADTWWNVDVSLISAAEPCCADLFS